jgi:glycosyltransferase involved in cell wall biosynthesis
MKLLIVGGGEFHLRLARAGLTADWTISAADQPDPAADVIYTPALAGGLAVAGARAGARAGSAQDQPRWLTGVGAFDLMADYQQPSLAEELARALRSADGLLPHSHGVAGQLESRGLTGRIFPACVPPGALAFEPAASLRSASGSIAVDGRHSLLERGLVALAALRLAAAALRDHEVIVLNAGVDVALAAELLAADTGVRVRVVPPEATDSAAVARAHAAALVSVHLTLDPDLGSWESAALAHGSVPIVAARSTLAAEWPREAVCVPVDPEDPRETAAAIERAATDRRLRQRARSANPAFARKRLDFESASRELAHAIVALAGARSQ